MVILEQQTSEFKVLGVGKVPQVASSASVSSLGQSIPVQVFHVEACATSTLSLGQHIVWPNALLARYSNLLLQIRYENSGLFCG